MHVGRLRLPDLIVSADRLDDIPSSLVTCRDAGLIFPDSGLSWALRLCERTGEFETDTFKRFKMTHPCQASLIQNDDRLGPLRRRW